MAGGKDDWRTRPVAGIGIVGLDHVAVTDTWERDTKSTATRYFEQVGGPVPTALMAMARLGLDHRPLFYGSVGGDSAGVCVRERLREAGVDTSFAVAERGTTPHSLVVLDTSDGTRALASYKGEALAELANVSFDRSAGLLHLDSRWTSFMIDAVWRKFDPSMMVSVDLGSVYFQRQRIAFTAQILIASKKGANEFHPKFANNPIDQTKRFLEDNLIAGVTLGADGVVIGCRDENGGEPVHLPAFRVPNAVDTCGAGDLFHGAFLWAYREGKTVIESATFAQAAVALRIQHYGNVAGQPTREQVEAFLAGVFDPPVKAFG